jgi:hypothetical protein
MKLENTEKRKNRRSKYGYNKRTYGEKGMNREDFVITCPTHEEM